jgi:hypothetical protein
MGTCSARLVARLGSPPLKTDDPADPPLYPSAFFEQHRRDYYDLMLAVSQRGAFAD